MTARAPSMGFSRRDFPPGFLWGVATSALQGQDPLIPLALFQLLATDPAPGAQSRDKRFGLVHVDFETLDRQPRASWQALARALARHGSDRAERKTR